jgi:hypothetical protein
MKKLLLLTTLFISSLGNSIFACSCVYVENPLTFCEYLAATTLSMEFTVVSRNDSVVKARVLHVINGSYEEEFIELKNYKTPESTTKIFYNEDGTIKYIQLTPPPANSCGYSTDGYNGYQVGDTMLAGIGYLDAISKFHIPNNICGVYHTTKRNGSYDPDLVTCEIDGIVGLKKQETNSISLFPNPSTGSISLSKASDFSIFDLQGNLLGQYFDTQNLDLNALKSGMYALVLDSDKKRQVIKFVIE